MALTEKQERFVAEYLVDLNATAAAKRANYSERTAYSMGQRLLKKVEIQAAIQEAIKKRARRTEITQDMVLKELAAIAFSNGADFAQVVVREVPEDCWDPVAGVYRKVPRLVQLVQLANTADIPEERKAAISSIKEGKHGIEVGSYDKIRALELLGKHLGLFDGKGGSDADPENNLLQAIEESLQEDIDTDDLPEVQ